MKTVQFDGEFAAWREAARELLSNGIPPEMVVWDGRDVGQESLLDTLQDHEVPDRTRRQLAVQTPRVSRGFVEIAERVAHHRDPARWPLLYRLLWRITHGETRLLQAPVDDDVSQLRVMDRDVRRDARTMRSSIHFRGVKGPGGDHRVAWYEPEHLIVPLVADSFRTRLAPSEWAILTPDTSVISLGDELEFGPGIPRSRAPSDEELESVWLAYYGARVRNRTPNRAFEHRPETAAGFVPDTPDLGVLRAAVGRCRACGLCAASSGPVFGAGAPDARLMLVGDQPGDCEDRGGEPFIGPAGGLLDRGLESAGLDRRGCYLTNAVKAFKHDAHQDKRIPKRPDAYEMQICRPWLEAEIRAVAPTVIVALGATAAHAVTGHRVAIPRERGEQATPLAEHCIVTFHPSALLRIPDQAGRQRRFEQFVHDLACAFRLSRD